MDRPGFCRHGVGKPQPVLELDNANILHPFRVDELAATQGRPIPIVERALQPYLSAWIEQDESPLRD